MQNFFKLTILWSQYKKFSRWDTSEIFDLDLACEMTIWENGVLEKWWIECKSLYRIKLGIRCFFFILNAIYIYFFNLSNCDHKNKTNYDCLCIPFPCSAFISRHKISFNKNFSKLVRSRSSVSIDYRHQHPGIICHVVIRIGKENWENMINGLRQDWRLNRKY